ncbi:hypothetical protein NPX13_g10302 [Xylaria arbuscula]|uniref:Transmembrane protein n=1 Tax=Xylaria arbuscula TaxID=114810 RepID=A0A9W8N4T7_9PEZI|nr:hypothetical protein NPX13_g10302 [Xylaria arbuscula]
MPSSPRDDHESPRATHRCPRAVPGIAAPRTKSPAQTKGGRRSRSHGVPNNNKDSSSSSTTTTTTARDLMEVNTEARTERRSSFVNHHHHHHHHHHRPEDQVTAQPTTLQSEDEKEKEEEKEKDEEEEDCDDTMDRWERIFRFGAQFSIYVHVCMVVGSIVSLTVTLGTLIRGWDDLVNWFEDYLSDLREREWDM